MLYPLQFKHLILLLYLHCIAEGDFVIDTRYEPVSAVYAIGVSCELQKPLQIEIQYCVELTEESHCKKLIFAKAEHDGITPPYHLDPILGGSFSKGSDYGTILNALSFRCGLI